MRIFAALAALGIVQAVDGSGGQGGNTPGGNDGADNGNNGGNNGNNGNSGAPATPPAHKVWKLMKTKLEASPTKDILTPAAKFEECLAKTDKTEQTSCKTASDTLLKQWGKVAAEDKKSAAWYQDKANEADADKRTAWADAWTAKKEATPECLAAAMDADAYLKGAYAADPPQKAEKTAWQVAEYTHDSNACMEAMATAGGLLDKAGAGSNAAAYATAAAAYKANVADAKTALDAAKKACDKANVTCETPSSGSNVWVWVLVILALVLVGFGVWWTKFRDQEKSG